VVVVGAGIVGAACAYALARRGLSVLVLDSRFVAAGVTAAGMGHIVVMDDSEPQMALTALGRRLWSEFAPDLTPDCEDDPCGTLWIAADAEEMEAVRRKAAAYRAHGLEAEVLSEPELITLEPQLRPGLAGALLVPEDRVLYPPNAARWLLQRACALGAEVREGIEVRSLDARGAVVADGRIDTGHVVNAAGPQAARLTPGLPVEPRKGHLVITDRYPGFCRHQLVELGYLKSAHSLAAPGPSVAFNVQPRSTGQILVGSSREFAGYDDRVQLGVVSRMIRRAVEFLPALARLSAIRAWTGLRPSTSDRLPLIGRWPGAGEPGPWIAAGHEGLGITTAPATGELLAALVTGQAPPCDPSPFAPGRTMPASARA
jgi:D-hydroxyproline dehydrogenase subunit beta